MKDIFLSFGSNSGRRFTNVFRGLCEIIFHSTVKFSSISSFYLTEPVDYEKQRWFVNLILKAKTALTPQVLLNYIQRIELMLGRVATVPKGPRLIDIDILFYENENMQSETLIIPHPELHKRNFILRAMLDMGEDVYHPVLGKHISQIYKDLHSNKKTYKIPNWLVAQFLPRGKEYARFKLLVNQE